MIRDIINEKHCIEDVNASEAACKTVLVKGCECLTFEEAMKKYVQLQKQNPFARYDVYPIR